MSLHARTLVTSGARRVVTPVGIGLFVTFALVLAGFSAAVNTLLTAVAGTALPLGIVIAEYAVVLPVHPVVAALVVLLTPLVGAFAVVVGSRMLLGDTVSRWSDPVECLTDRVIPVTLVTLVAITVSVVAVGFGTVLLVVPGLVLAGHFLLVPTVLAAENVDLGTALRTSWHRARGDRLELVTASVALVGPGAVVVGVASLSYVLPAIVEFVVGVVVGAVLLSLWLGLATTAYQATTTETTRSTATSRNRRASRAL